MEKIKAVSDLSLREIDFVVAECNGRKRIFTSRKEFGIEKRVKIVPPYSTEWMYGGPLIEKEKIEIFPCGFKNPNMKWGATNEVCVDRDGDINSKDFYGKTPLEAAMRCYINSKIGEYVKIEKEFK